MTTHHRHYPNDLATWRLLLAYQRGDELAKQTVMQQLGECARCWQAVARYTINRILKADLPEGDPVDWIEARLIAMLDEYDLLDMLDALDDAHWDAA